VAFSQIAERIEGNTGLRVDDIDPEDPERSRASRVTENTRALITSPPSEKKPGDAARCIDVETTLDIPPKEGVKDAMKIHSFALGLFAPPVSERR